MIVHTATVTNAKERCRGEDSDRDASLIGIEHVGYDTT